MRIGGAQYTYESEEHEHGDIAIAGIAIWVLAIGVPHRGRYCSKPDEQEHQCGEREAEGCEDEPQPAGERESPQMNTARFIRTGVIAPLCTARSGPMQSALWCHARD